MGLSSSPRCFTKILKLVYVTLRRKGHISKAYIDDLFAGGPPNNIVHKMYQIQFICLIIWDLRYIIRSQSQYQQKKSNLSVCFEFS